MEDASHDKSPDTQGSPPAGTDPRAELQRILSIVHRYVSNRGIDTESLASEIWLELWQKQLPVRRVFVHARTIDEIRRRIRQRRYEQSQAAEGKAVAQSHTEPSRSDETVDASSIINAMVSDAKLDRDQKQLVFFRFYLGLSGSEISLRTGESPSSVNRRLALIIAQLKETPTWKAWSSTHPSPECG